MHLRYELMKTLQDERVRAAARDHLAAEARRAQTKQGAILGLGIPLGAIVLQLKKSLREIHAGKGAGRSPESALTRMRAGQNE